MKINFIWRFRFKDFLWQICIENLYRKFAWNLVSRIYIGNLFGNLFKNLQKRVKKKNWKKELKKRIEKKILHEKNVFSGREKLNFARLPVVYRLNKTLTDKYAIVALADAEKRLKLRWLVITKNPWLWLHIVWVIK